MPLAGCGEGEGSEETTAQDSLPAETRSPEKPADGDQGSAQADRDRDEAAPEPSSEPRVVENPTPKQLGVTPGADNSLQTFGEQAQGSERDEVVRRMRAFFTVLAQRGVNAACPYFSDSYKQSLTALARGSGQDGCAALAQLTGRSSPKGALRAEALRGANATVLRVGIEDEDAIVLLRATDGELVYFTMQREDGEWRTSTVGLAQLPPRAG